MGCNCNGIILGAPIPVEKKVCFEFNQCSNDIKKAFLRLEYVGNADYFIEFSSDDKDENNAFCFELPQDAFTNKPAGRYFGKLWLDGDVDCTQCVQFEYAGCNLQVKIKVEDSENVCC